MTRREATASGPLAAVVLHEGLPEPWPEPLLPRIRRLARGRAVAILDDDPTGTQTVRGVPVLTSLDGDGLVRILQEAPRAAFVLTNSRSLEPEHARRLGGRAGKAIAAASVATGRPVSVVSRSDSTLRGHFPIEVDALADGLGRPAARTVLMPFFGGGGRVTVDDVHYLVRDGVAVPVAETEYARDAAFGFRHSNLVEWVRERVADGRPVVSLPLSTIRGGGPEAVMAALMATTPRTVVVANAAAERDVEVVAAAVLMAERAGLPLIARTAASFVRARLGQPPAGLLSADELPVGGGTGVVVVGSHVPTTTRQLERLLDDPPAPVGLVELDAAAAAVARTARRAGADATQRVAALLADGRIPVIATSRTPLPADRSLRQAARISTLLTSVVARLPARPAWVVAKGGITSSDVATGALGIRVAMVLGQVRAGVPVWRSGRDSRWPGLMLVVFPGNVGEDDDLRATVATLVAAGQRGAASR